MTRIVSSKETFVKGRVSFPSDDVAPRGAYRFNMGNIDAIHQGKTPPRLHFIAEWAERRGLRQADFVEALDVTKGNVSKWFNGMLPEAKNIVRIADLLRLEDPKDLFRHPDDDWISRLLSDRPKEEKDRIIAMIEAAFPKRA